MKTVQVKVKGTSPLMMHSDRTANPLDPITKELKKYSSKRKKTDDDHAMMAYLEFIGGIYHDEIIGPYIPSKVIKATTINAAKKTKEGPKIREGVIVQDEKNSLQYKGPRDIDGLWDDGNFSDTRSVVVGQSRCMRTRPVFPEWVLSFTLCLDESIIDTEDLKRILETSGALIGYCDYRPQKGGEYGRFLVKEVK